MKFLLCSEDDMIVIQDNDILYWKTHYFLLKCKFWWCNIHEISLYAKHLRYLRYRHENHAAEKRVLALTSVNFLFFIFHNLLFIFWGIAVHPCLVEGDPLQKNHSHTCCFCLFISVHYLSSFKTVMPSRRIDVGNGKLVFYCSIF